MLGRKSNARRSNARHSGVRHSTLNRPSIMSATIPFNAYSDKLDSIDEVDNTKKQEENASNTALTNWENLRKAVPTVIDVESILKQHAVVLITENFGESAGRCRSVQKIISNLGLNDIDSTDLKVIPLDLRPADGPMIGKYIAQSTGYTNVPVLFIDGECIGNYQNVLNQARSGALRTKLIESGISGIVSAIPASTLDMNIYGYPKALSNGQEGNRRNDLTAPLNVLIGACGSSAADKIPQLVEACVDKGWAVKLICTTSGEHFFKTHGMTRILDSIGADNVYRDEDEWSFDYDTFGMPVRAAHLALRKWADVMVVAPITCNSMAKAVAGIGDNLLSSVFVAWEYQKKRMIFCPACNVDMWNNAPTQRNVAYLKEMGIEFLGPRVDRLTNGQVAIGCMEYVDKIVDTLKQEENELMSGVDWYWRRAKSAASSNNDTLWELVLRAVEEKLFDVTGVEGEYGNTLLHLAVGGEPVDEGGKYSYGKPSLGAMKRLIEAGADVNVRNKEGLSALHLAVSAQDIGAIESLLASGANCQGILVDIPNVTPEIRKLLNDKPGATKLATTYYFTYGSLKRGFPNHENESDHLQNFVGKAKTVEAYPLVVPFEKSCKNPNCPYLHQQANLIDQPRQGKNVHGEVFEVSLEDIAAFDTLEGFKGIVSNENVYSRRIIEVDIEGKGKASAYVYFTTSSEPMQLVAAGEAEYISEYLLDMAKGELKPEFAEEKVNVENEVVNGATRITQKKRVTNRDFLSRMTMVAPAATAAAAPAARAPQDCVNLRLTQTPVGRYNPEFKLSIGSVQQTINTCNLASIVLALKSLKIDCSVDDIFSALRLPIGWVIDGGLTLAQVFNILVKLSGSTYEGERLVQDNVTVECFHFDEEVANLSDLSDFLERSLAKKDNVLVVNFNTKIARGLEKGGGHFSVISGYDEATRMVSIADVHPKKYGAHYAVKDAALFDAMVDKDSSSKRARGLIRVSLLSTAKSIRNLDACQSAVAFCDSTMFDSRQIGWLSRWGDLPTTAFESHVNMGGLNALALALSGFLSEEDYYSIALPNHLTADYLAWNLSLSITDLLSNVTDPYALTNHACSACKVLSLNLNVRTQRADLESADTLSKFFSANVGTSGVALVLVNINEALGFEAVCIDEGSEAAMLDHGRSHWCVVVSVVDTDKRGDTVIIADPCAKQYGRLWKCKMENLRAGLIDSDGDSNVVIVKEAPKAKVKKALMKNIWKKGHRTL